MPFRRAAAHEQRVLPVARARLAQRAPPGAIFPPAQGSDSKSAVRRAVPEAVRPEVEGFLQTRQPSMIRDLATAAPARAPAQAGEVRDLASYKRWCAAAPPEPRQLERGLTAD